MTTDVCCLQTGLAARWRPCCGLPDPARHWLHPAESAVHQGLRIEPTTCRHENSRGGEGETYLPPPILKKPKPSCLSPVSNVFSSLSFGFLLYKDNLCPTVFLCVMWLTARPRGTEGLGGWMEWGWEVIIKVTQRAVEVSLIYFSTAECCDGFVFLLCFVASFGPWFLSFGDVQLTARHASNNP